MSLFEDWKKSDGKYTDLKGIAPNGRMSTPLLTNAGPPRSGSTCSQRTRQPMEPQQFALTASRLRLLNRQSEPMSTEATAPRRPCSPSSDSSTLTNDTSE